MIKIIRPALPLYYPASILATWGGCGLIRPAPGTWGSLAALPFAWLIVSLGGHLFLLLATLLLFLLGCWASHIYERSEGAKDPHSVVIDEVVGQWLTLVFAPLEISTYFVCFLLFRIADITKPWPAKLIDRKMPGGLGIMLDDIVAGLYAILSITLLKNFGII